MNVSFIGRVNNIPLPPRKALLPLFEAVVNSIQAIKAAPDGFVDVVLLRNNSQQEIDPGDSSSPITGFIVRDNGEGFTEDNLSSFKTCDSRHKQSVGGKGVGRLLWLKAFSKISVESIFQEGSSWKTRQFSFRLSDAGVENEFCKDTDLNQRQTSVYLDGLDEKYQNHCPHRAQTLAMRLIEHTLLYLMRPTCPKITILDGEKSIVLNQIFKEDIQTSSSSIKVSGSEFNIVNLRFYKGEEDVHRLHLCAHDREVFNENLSRFIPNLSRKLRDETDEPFIWSSYIFGKYLDDHVDFIRGSFDFPREDSQQSSLKGIGDEDLSLPQLRESVLEHIKRPDLLGAYLEPIRKKKMDRIKKYVSENAPQYRAIVKHRPELMDSISPDLSDEKLELELYKIHHKAELSLREKGQEFLRLPPQSLEDVAEYKEQYRRFLEEENDIGKANLAQYVVHRKLILDLLSKRLSQNSTTTKYQLEDSIHNSIFPIRTISDDVRYEQQNLWIIDERLSYHSYLASDKRFTSIHPQAAPDFQVQSTDRPDLLIFNNSPFAFVEGGAPFSSLVIIEFKRPGRESYSDNDNPINQVYGYAKKIREGTAKDRHGRPIEVMKDIPIYGYILCDIVSKIREFATFGSFTESPDGRGFFFYNSPLKTYIEVISYNKMLDDAKKRNRILFDRLCIRLPE